ncbi:MAG: hypothetical protein AAF378_08300 [Cyanobacteria bacterium P01_A01_bin.84]
MFKTQESTFRSLLVGMLVVGGFGLAIIDPEFRPAFADIIKFGAGGYLGQLLPQGNKE